MMWINIFILEHDKLPHSQRQNVGQVVSIVSKVARRRKVADDVPCVEKAASAIASGGKKQSSIPVSQRRGSNSLCHIADCADYER